MSRPKKRVRLSDDDGTALSATRYSRKLSNGHDSSKENVESSVDEESTSQMSNASDEDRSELQRELRTVSFGALVEAQELAESNNSTEAQRKQSSTRGNPEKLKILQERLAQLRRLKKDNCDGAGHDSGREALSEQRPPHASSKHAPTEQSSKHAVTRKRPIIELPQNPYHARDPRFSSAHGIINMDKVKRNYSFLDDYRAGELAEAKAVLKKTKNLDEQEALKKQIMAMENRIRAEREKDLAREVKREHKLKEKELVQQGKKPYFLKKGEMKKQVIAKKFEGMKGVEKQRAMQRKRKKEEGKEKRAIPGTRRS